jgi:hypothetical protein
MTTSDASIQQVATRMIPEKIRWGILLAVFVLQSVTAALLAAYSAIGADSPVWISFAAAFLLAISAPVTLLAAVNVTKTPTDTGVAMGAATSTDAG